MSESTDEQKITRIIDLLAEFKELLIRGGGANLVPGLNSVASILIFSEESDSMKLKSAATSYRQLFGGSGTLGDFVACKSDKSIDLLMNQKIESLEKELWSIFFD